MLRVRKSVTMAMRKRWDGETGVVDIDFELMCVAALVGVAVIHSRVLGYIPRPLVIPDRVLAIRFSSQWTLKSTPSPTTERSFA
jgi:hypothetical protein